MAILILKEFPRNPFENSPTLNVQLLTNCQKLKIKNPQESTDFERILTDSWEDIFFTAKPEFYFGFVFN